MIVVKCRHRSSAVPGYTTSARTFQWRNHFSACRPAFRAPSRPRRSTPGVSAWASGRPSQSEPFTHWMILYCSGCGRPCRDRPCLTAVSRGVVCCGAFVYMCSWCVGGGGQIPNGRERMNSNCVFLGTFCLWGTPLQCDETIYGCSPKQLNSCS